MPRIPTSRIPDDWDSYDDDELDLNLEEERERRERKRTKQDADEDQQRRDSWRKSNTKRS
jgi:hypothetical protein